MGTRSTAIAGMIVLFGTAAGVATIASAQGDPCDREPREFSLKIKVKNDVPTEVVKGLFGWENADRINVCRGDTIKWKIQHSNEYQLRFPNGTPVGGDKLDSRNGKIETTVRSDAERGREYKYDIALSGGGVLDPIIILD